MDKVNMTKNNNRRVFFRIYEEVDLFYKKIDEKFVTEPHPAFESIFNDSLSATDSESVSQNPALLLPTPEENLPNLQSSVHETREVNISRSGMAFYCIDAFKEGDYLALKILLASSMAAVVTCGKVVYCKASNPFESHDPYRVGVNFIDREDDDLTLLDKHVHKRKLQHIAVDGLILFAVITTIVAPDMVFGLLFELFHLVFEHFLEFLHLAFEFIELNLDHLVEHLFHTNLKQTQIIVFYILVFFASLGLYFLWRAVPPFCQRCKKNQILYWSRKKASWLFYWREQSLFNKIKLVVIAVAAVTGYVFLGM